MAEEIITPLAGKIISVNVEVGETVEEEEELMLVEAMKMENPILSPIDGTVKEVKVKADDVVVANQLLMIIE